MPIVKLSYAAGLPLRKAAAPRGAAARAAAARFGASRQLPEPGRAFVWRARPALLPCLGRRFPPHQISKNPPKAQKRLTTANSRRPPGRARKEPRPGKRGKTKNKTPRANPLATTATNAA